MPIGGFFFFSSRRRHTIWPRDWSSDVCSSDLRLETDEKGKLPAFAARLAVTLATTPGPATLQQETALEQASAKAPPDAEVFALLARAALERGDAPRAAALYARLETLQPGTPRAGHGAGLALLGKRDAAGGKAAFEKVLQTAPGH